MKQVVACVLCVVLLSLAGCECMSGLGRDIEHCGQWLERTADGVGK